ncbi:MAG: hypothetical protein WDO56_32150 [Gammaproteobacteria bacterium]
MRRRSGFLLLACAAGISYGQAPFPSEPQAVPTPPPTRPADIRQRGETDDEWLDRTQMGVHELVWKSAMHLDQWFGSKEPPDAYQGASGSISPALLWDEFDGWQPKLRFRVDVPLPQLNERFHAFVGKVDPDEYVSERAPQSGAFRRTYGQFNEDQTLAGIVYRTPPSQGGRFDAGAGVRVRLPLDPYIKGSYIYERGDTMTGLFSIRETAFWQNSEHAGVTSRMDLERLFEEHLWLLRWTTSASFSEKSEGVYGYSAVTALRGLPNRRALAFEVGVDGVMDQEVPLHDFGFKAAYRQSIARDWLIMEWRTSLTWPKEERDQPRKPSWGLGVGFEMFFGTDEFLARPVTF